MKTQIAPLLFPFLILLGSCAGPSPAPPKMLHDGELAVPADYRSWPIFLNHVDRPDLKQVRDIWINPIGARARSGQDFANGTQLVMALYAAKTHPDGTLLTVAGGKLVKDKLLKVFIMGKDAGWGQGAPEGLKNGDWIYAAYLADAKTPSGDPSGPCRTCHLPLAGQDFVFRSDEYFSSRPKPEPHPLYERRPLRWFGGY